ncbi:MAG TPA: condensation domain-containing protein, partial [Blastocatellia bacterium]|nr:condensation domain-containing protein [Blastocatellia bacterium]
MQEVIEGFRLSPQQKHLWLLQEADAARPYRARCAILIEGHLDQAVLKATLESTVERHESLRTAFPSLALVKIPLQSVARCQVEWSEYVDLCAFGPEEQDAEITKLYEESSHAAVDLQHGQLVSARLIGLSSSRHLLLLSMPALSIDSAGLGNLVVDLSRLYANGSPDDDPESQPLQYALASEWFNELLESEQAKAGREYWRGKDMSPAFALRLPFEKRLGAPAGFRPSTLSLRIGPELASGVESLAGRLGAYTESLMLACWQVLLFKMTGQGDIVVGVDFDGRTDQELREAVGLLARCLPVGCPIDSDSRVKDLANRVERLTEEVAEWQECFAWDEDGPGETRFFPFCFGFERRMSAQAGTGGLRFSIRNQTVYFDRFKLKLQIAFGDDHLAEFHFDSTAIPESEVTRLASRFMVLLGSVVSNPSASVSELVILDEAELRQLIFEFNDTKTGNQTGRLLHRLFEEQAEAIPSHTAVIFGSESLTYRELNEKANRLAHHLIKSGVGPETIVALSIDRSTDLVVALMAILKSGAAYLPLDPSYPPHRLEFMLSDCRASIALTQASLASLFAGKMS